MLKPNPIIESEVRIHAINDLSDAMFVRWIARSVRFSARTVPLSFGAVSIGSMGPFLCNVFSMSPWRAVRITTVPLCCLCKRTSTSKNLWIFPCTENADVLDTVAGKDEILARRIGDNELAAIEVIFF